MVEGTVKLANTTWGWLFYGHGGATRLFFEERGKPKRSVIPRDESRMAHRCPSCSGIFIAQLPAPFQQQTGDFGTCGECGISLKRGYPGCHWCGWKPKEQPKGE